MSADTTISWCHATFNPWWGCTKVSEGCKHCYADTLATRYGHTIWGPRARRRFFGDKHWAEPLKWNKQAMHEGQRKRVFCASMADVCEVLPADHPDLEAMAAARLRLWETIEATPMLDWLLLTKRPENIIPLFGVDAPVPNIWWGTSVENQAAADTRIPELLKVPAHVRFLSCEPLLGPVDLWGPELRAVVGASRCVGAYSGRKGDCWVVQWPSSPTLDHCRRRKWNKAPRL